MISKLVFKLLPRKSLTQLEIDEEVSATFKVTSKSKDSMISKRKNYLTNVALLSSSPRSSMQRKKL